MLPETSVISDATPSRPASFVPGPLAGRSGMAPRPESPRATGLGSLVLTRHLGESIMIGEEVEVQVAAIKAGVARLKVIAPRTIAVHRHEVFASIRAGVEPARPSRPELDRPHKPGGGLVLARSAQQSIMIGDQVEVMVVEVRPTTVKLKITAPRSVDVHRMEIFEAIRDSVG